MLGMNDRTASAAYPELPGYEFLECLGIGGTSKVWRARQISLDRVVAIKILSPQLLQDETARNQFQTEARAAAQISHPAMVGILDFGEYEGTLYYVMEYVQGTSLAVWLEEHHQMAPAQALLLTGIVAEALDRIWREYSLIHCDIKPGNILLGKDGAVKLTDLGLARVVGAAVQHDPGVLEGTPTYLAPEQIEGQEPDCRSDIYSLGLTLYHLLTGRPPFEGRSLQETLEAQQTDYLPDPRNIRSAIPVHYGWLLTKMTAKDPAKRPTSWQAVLKDIHQLQAGKVPLPPYPAEDASTILLQPQHRPGARSNTINLSAAAHKAIHLSATQQEMLKVKRPNASQAASSGRGGCLRALIFLLFLCGAGFAIYHFGLKNHPEFQALLRGQKLKPPSGAPNLDVHGTTENLQAVIDGDQSETASASVPTAPVADELTPQLAGGGDTGTATPGAWNDSRYIAAAQLFNQALLAYQTFQKKPEPSDPALLQIISDAQHAAEQFETIRPDAPASVPITRYANQCYQLVNDARHARLDTAARRVAHFAAPKTHNAMLSPWPTPAADPADPFAPRFMQFGYAWDVLPAPMERPDATEFIFLMAALGLQSSADTRARPDLLIHGPLKWLMPLEKAQRLLSAAPAPRVPVEGAPFPYGGFFMVSCTAPARWGTLSAGGTPYPTLRLLADAEDRLVGIQLVDPSPAPPKQHPPMGYTDGNKTLDFVTGQSAPERGDIRLSHKTLKGMGTVRIDTEAVDFGVGADGTPIYRSSLILPESVAQNLLYHLLGTAQ